MVQERHTVKEHALIIFVKEPSPGLVKTRFQPLLTAEVSAEIYRAFLLDTLDKVFPLPDIKLLLACYPSKESPFFYSLSKEYQLSLMDQRGNDLGERMQHAFVDVISYGFKKSVIIGADSPTLPISYIKDTFPMLDQSELVIGPSLDGGYYLIGIRDKVPPVFEGIPWGTVDVLQLTLKKVVSHGISAGLLSFWYDVDTIEDLKFLVGHLSFLSHSQGEIPARTFKLLEGLQFDNIIKSDQKGDGNG